MTDKQVLIIATLTAKAGKGDELAKVLQACVGPSHAEAGNVHYDLYRSEANPDAFLFHETWKSAAAVAEHEQQPHYLALQQGAAPLLAAAPVVSKISV
ncbi:putative quinol monooxygenase [Erwinia sp. Leaf53]|uniref:putative quinol monooxygenase n=1 Tax=Erwinia sp. Leaf53 TaxID=1736225 RepID=UPI0006FCD853|nr:putative quinol monooxygenase [Erwinia sp. Leaf53]KQN55741.1 drug:proton antiporter [Erwinia sp. Leaf53]